MTHIAVGLLGVLVGMALCRAIDYVLGLSEMRE